MRTLLLVASVLLFSPALAQDCANDYSGTQITDGFNYEIAYETDLARNSLDFLNGASNWFYFNQDGWDLQDDLVGLIRYRDLPVYFPACNDIGQCASISVQSMPLVIFGINWPGVHLGFNITATFNGSTSSRFFQTDSRVYYNRLSAAAAADKRCRDNQGYLKDEPVVPNQDDEEDDYSEDEEENENADDDEEPWEDDWEWPEEEEEPCDACEFFFDGDEDGDLNLDEPYDPTDDEWELDEEREL